MVNELINCNYLFQKGYDKICASVTTINCICNKSKSNLIINYFKV